MNVPSARQRAGEDAADRGARDLLARLDELERRGLHEGEADIEADGDEEGGEQERDAPTPRQERLG